MLSTLGYVGSVLDNFYTLPQLLLISFFSISINSHSIYSVLSLFLSLSLAVHSCLFTLSRLLSPSCFNCFCCFSLFDLFAFLRAQKNFEPSVDIVLKVNKAVFNPDSFSHTNNMDIDLCDDMDIEAQTKADKNDEIIDQEHKISKVNANMR